MRHPALHCTLLASAGLLATGCTVPAARIGAYLQCKAEAKAARRDLSLSQIEALKAELEAERRALAAERERDILACRADAEKRECAARSQLEESVRTRMGLDVDQKMVLGPLQVDAAKFQQLLAERERSYAEQVRQAEDERRRFESEEATGGPCCRCATPRCEAPAPGCEVPHPVGCCQHCGLPPRRPAQVADCAGVRPFKQPPRKPVQQPILPVDIPFMVPVTMQVGVTNSALESSGVRRLPYESAPPRRGLGEECPECHGVGPCPRCAPPPACEAPPPCPGVTKAGKAPNPVTQAVWDGGPDQ